MNPNSLHHAVSSASGHPLSFHGLEGVSDGDKASASSSMASSASEKKKKGKEVIQQQQQQQQPPRCQVEGCHADLSGAKAYYCRHKVCGMHSKSPMVIVAGIQQRFCQQCSRFHQLHEFDQGKRSCRKRLECHNKRRRKPPLGPTSFNTNCIPSAFHEDNNSNNNRFKGFLVDFTNPKLPSLLQVAWQRGQLSDDQVHSHGYHSGSRAPSAIVVNHRDFPFMQQVSPPGSSQPLTGGSDSSCALSLLSTQPWDNHMGISATAEGAPTIKPIACENDYMSNSWTPKDLETSSRTSFEVRVNQVREDESGSHFAGELELVLQGKKQFMGLDLSRRCKDSDEGIHWSL